MIGEVVLSQYEDIGPINPGLMDVPAGNNLRGFVDFKTVVDEQGDSVIKKAGRFSVINSISQPRDIADTDFFDPSENIAKVILQVDACYRGHREIPDDKSLIHSVYYMSGTNRSDVGERKIMMARLLRMTLPSGTHFDDFMKSNEEAVFVNHGGNPTRIFTGPIRKFFPDNGKIHNGDLSRLFMPPSEKVSNDRAILIDGHTLHRRSAQFHSPSKPSSFLRTVIGAGVIK